MQKNTKQVKAAKEKVPKTYVMQSYDIPLEVLIIGTRNKEKYVTLVNNLGLKPIWFDPFQESMHRLDGYVSHADIIIACKDHMLHSVLVHIDANMPNTFILGNDTVTTMTATIHSLINKNILAQLHTKVLSDDNETTETLIDAAKYQQ